MSNWFKSLCLIACVLLLAISVTFIYDFFKNDCRYIVAEYECNKANAELENLSKKYSVKNEELLNLNADLDNLKLVLSEKEQTLSEKEEKLDNISLMKSEREQLIKDIENIKEEITITKETYNKILSIIPEKEEELLLLRAEYENLELVKFGNYYLSVGVDYMPMINVDRGLFYIYSSEIVSYDYGVAFTGEELKSVFKSDIPKFSVRNVDVVKLYDNNKKLKSSKFFVNNYYSLNKNTKYVCNFYDSNGNVLDINNLVSSKEYEIKYSNFSFSINESCVDAFKIDFIIWGV